MKKIFLLLVFFIGLVPTFKSGNLVIETSQNVYAQTECYTDPGVCAERESLWEWLARVIKAVGGFIQDTINAMGQGGGGGPESGGINQALLYSMLTGANALNPPSGATHYGNSTGGGNFHPNWPINLPDDLPDPNFEDCAGVMGGNAFYDQCSTCVGGTTGLLPCYVPPPPDCAGVLGGAAYLDSCNICVGGTTGKLPCTRDCNNVLGGTAYADGCHACAGGNTLIVPCDTVKPKPVICDTIAIANSNKTTQIIDSLNTQPRMIVLRNGVHDGVEHAISTFDSAGHYKVFKDTALNSTLISSQITIFDTSTGPNHKNIVAFAHTHNDYGDPQPDNGDIYTLTLARLLVNKKLYRSFIVSALAGTDLAIVVTDTSAALLFNNLYPKDSAIYYSDTAIIINPTTGDTLRRPVNPTWGNFYGIFGQDSLSMEKEFENAFNKLRLNHYPEILLRTYAQVYMIQRYNMGVKIMIKINGIFKELSPLIIRDTNNVLQDLKIKICL